MPVSLFPTARRSAALLILGAFALLQASCRPVQDVAPGAVEPPPALSGIPAGYTRYRVISDESEVRVLVYRAGPMARLGHNHVLSSRSLTGDVFLNDRGGDPRVSLVLPVGTFSVDEAELRVEEGADFPGTVDEDAISGTKKNLLSESLLDAARFPEISLTSRKVTGSSPDYTMNVAVEVKGETHDLQVPVRVERGATELRATGSFTVTHAELGLQPFSVMGGLLSVKDEISIGFQIVARSQ